ncbi:MAG TPA: DUF3352 domain-containing protein [Cyclobacteriaceae bacterium]|nr:DUF3352 domain-containing protein [Cyclobacteriaceae bacterium]
MRFLKWVILLAFLGGIGWFGFNWYRTQQQTLPEDTFSLIPDDAVYFIATGDPFTSWKDISSSGAWIHLQRNPHFAELTASVNSLDSLIRDNDLLFKLLASRAVLVSAHMISTKDYDFLFLVDLKDVSGIKFLNEYLTTFSLEGYNVSKEKYGDDDVIILHDMEKNADLFLSLPGSHLVASYNKRIITSALDARKTNTGLPAEKFIELSKDLETGMMQLYLNYDNFPQFWTSYTTGTNEYVNRFSRALRTTSLSITLEEELISASGFTSVNDSVESYLKTLAVSGKGQTEFLELAPQRTAFCLGLGFTKFSEFFLNFEKNIQEDVAEYKEYRDNLQQVENYLKISVQKNIIDWIGDEVALLELQSSGKGLNNETAVILKADNIETAKENLAHIQKQVKKKTPVKFKEVEYRGYTINYLGMKSFFKLILGKFFARYDKPYYTIVNNFVIFSNHPQTLESMIDDYLDKNTLVRSEEFRAFKKSFDDEGSVFVYLNTPVLFNTVKKMADAPTQMSMEENKEYIVCFRQIGFQLVPDQNRFKTFFAEQFVAPEPAIESEISAESELEVDSATSEEIEATESPKETDPMALPYIYVQNVNAKTHTEYFPDSTVQVKVELKNGFKDGSYTEYHENGEVKMTGEFKQDKRDGTWRLYDETGNLLLKRKYEEGEVSKERVKD